MVWRRAGNEDRKFDYFHSTAVSLFDVMSKLQQDSLEKFIKNIYEWNSITIIRTK